MRFPVFVLVAACLAGAPALAEDKAPEGTRRAEVAGLEVVDMQGATRVTLRVEGPGPGEAAEGAEGAKDVEGARLVDIFVGPAEGAAIARAREGIEPPRPMTHDLLASVVRSLGGRIARLTVSSLEGGTYIGELTISREGGEAGAETVPEEIRIDTRPSDGMALAVAAGAPIYVAEDVIEQVGRADPDEEKPKDADDGPQRPKRFGPPRELI